MIEAKTDEEVNIWTARIADGDQAELGSVNCEQPTVSDGRR